jgi:MOSC domain-containing protein YiiM
MNETVETLKNEICTLQEENLRLSAISKKHSEQFQQVEHDTKLYSGNLTKIQQTLCDHQKAIDTVTVHGGKDQEEIFAFHTQYYKNLFSKKQKN